VVWGVSLVPLISKQTCEKEFFSIYGSRITLFFKISHKFTTIGGTGGQGDSPLYDIDFIRFFNLRTVPPTLSPQKAMWRKCGKTLGRVYHTTVYYMLVVWLLAITPSHFRHMDFLGGQGRGASRDSEFSKKSGFSHSRDSGESQIRNGRKSAAREYTKKVFHPRQIYGDDEKSFVFSQKF